MDQQEKFILYVLVQKILAYTGTSEAILLLKNADEQRIQIVVAPDDLSDTLMKDLERLVTSFVQKHSTEHGSKISYLNRDGEAYEM